MITRVPSCSCSSLAHACRRRGASIQQGPAGFVVTNCTSSREKASIITLRLPLLPAAAAAAAFVARALPARARCAPAPARRGGPGTSLAVTGQPPWTLPGNSRGSSRRQKPKHTAGNRGGGNAQGGPQVSPRRRAIGEEGEHEAAAGARALPQSGANSSGARVLGSPLRLALVSAMGLPYDATTFRMKSLSGTRIPADEKNQRTERRDEREAVSL